MIGIGNAFGQMVKGDMLAQQSNQSDKKMDMVAHNFKRQRIMENRQDFNQGMYTAETTGDYGALNRYFDNFQEEIGEKHTASATNVTADMLKGPGRNLIFNKFKGDTGSDLDATNDEKALAQIKKSFMLSDEKSGLPRYATPGQFEHSTGYGDYKRSKIMEEKLLQAKLLTASKGTKDTDAQRLAKINSLDPDQLTDALADEQKTLMHSTGRNKSDAVESISTGGTYQPLLKKFGSGKWGTAADFEGEGVEGMMSQASRDQMHAGEGLSDARYNELNDSSATVGTMSRLGNIFANIGDDKVVQGEVETVLNDFMARASKEDFQAMSVPEQRKVLDSIRIKSQAGAAAAKILNEISGASVGEEEFGRTMKTLFGGDLQNMNPSSVAEALRGSADTYYQDARQKIQGIREKKAPYDKLRLAKQLATAYNPGSRQKLTSTGKETPATVVPKVAKEIAGQGIELGTNAISEVVIDPVEKFVEEKAEEAGSWWEGFKLKDPSTWRGGGKKVAPNADRITSSEQVASVSTADLQAMLKDPATSKSDRKYIIKEFVSRKGK